jgi:hypothetical protein
MQPLSVLLGLKVNLSGGVEDSSVVETDGWRAGLIELVFWRTILREDSCKYSGLFLLVVMRGER